MSLRIVAMTDELIDPVCTAFGHVFGEARSVDTWRKIYRASPDGAVGVVCLDGANAVAGYYGATLHRVVGTGCGSAVFGQIRDVFTHPTARGSGTGRGSLFARLYQEFEQRFGGRHIQISFGFPSERHFRLGARLLAYRRLAGLEMWVHEVPQAGNAAAARLGVLAPVACFGEEVDLLWTTRPATSAMVTPRTSAFLNWRFAPRPDRRYWRYRYDSYLAGGIAGYAVIARQGYEAWLADFRLPDDPDLRRDMWHQLVDRLARAGATRLHMIASAAVPETRCLPSLGCTAVAARPPWVPAYRPYGPGWPDSELGLVFHMTMADGDIL